MWHQWFNRNFTKQREYFLCTKKTKITTLFNNYLPPRPPDTILESITYVSNICCSVSAAPYVDTLFTLWSEHERIRVHTLLTLFTYVILSKMAHKKYSLLWVINDRIFIFGWTMPLSGIRHERELILVLTCHVTSSIWACASDLCTQCISDV